MADLALSSPSVQRPCLGVSSCLLGNLVRYDGTHKRDEQVVSLLGRLFDLLAICPELEMGMPVPREPIQLERQGEELRLRAVASRIDHTETMQAYAAGRTRELLSRGVCGYVFKSKSPSCGLENVKVFEPAGTFSRSGRGMFAAALVRAAPLLPVAEEKDLHAAPALEQFITRVLAFARLQRVFGHLWRLGEAAALHAREKFLVLAHDEAAYRRLGPLVARVKEWSPERFAHEYQTILLDALRRRPTVATHVNALHHLAGMLRDSTTLAERRKLHAAIEAFQRGEAPLASPRELLRRFAEAAGRRYVADQTYLAPHACERIQALVDLDAVRPAT